jgi:ABC-type Mn2+/Zn2+ transport system ATPase subunit
MPCECSSPRADLAVEAQAVQVSIEGRLVLQDVNLRIARGQLVALIGPNGAGKTTLLRCLLGLQRLAGGAIRLFGQEDLRGVLPRVGYVPQRWSLDRSLILSVREFLSLRLLETRHWFWRQRRRTDDLIAARLPELGVSAWFDQPLARLSGGQLQRVLIAFSLLAKPDLLLLDEPTAGVDTPGEQTFYDLIAEVHRQRGITVLLVSHDLSMVYRQATWVYALNRTVCCAGPPEQVMNAESLKAAYGIHVAPYQHHHVH